MTSYEEGLPDWVLPHTQFQVVTFHKDRSSSVRVWRLDERNLDVILALLGDPVGEAVIDAKYAAAGWDAGSPGMSYVTREEQ